MRRCASLRGNNSELHSCSFINTGALLPRFIWIWSYSCKFWIHYPTPTLYLKNVLTLGGMQVGNVNRHSPLKTHEWMVNTSWINTVSSACGPINTPRAAWTICSAQPMGARTAFSLDAPFYCVHSHPARWSLCFVFPDRSSFLLRCHRKSANRTELGQPYHKQ